MLEAAVLITGAGRHVGLALAQHFLSAGRPVIAHYHTHTDAVEHLRRDGALCVAGDLAKQEGVQALTDVAARKTLSLRAVIHNASAFAATAPAVDDALRQMDDFYALHMRAPYALTVALAPLLQACPEKHADVIHITDIYADKPAPAFDVYCATKAGLQNLALSFAKALAPKVKVNVVQPGPVLFKDWHSQEVRQKVLAQTLLGEEGGTEPIVLAIAAILANPYQTGAVVAVDGGRRLA
jgi:dihydromonapterin reductase/dihydrofolate reductase